MSITLEEIKHLAKLCRIELEAKELEKFRGDLNKILGYVEILKTVDTEGVEPLATVTGLENVMREDVAENSVLQGKILENAPERKGRFLRVKKVFSSS